jgi:hypothetical protein
MGRSLDYGQFENMLTQFKAVQKEYDAFIRKFLLEMGMRTLAQTKKLTPVDTGRLRNTWELSAVYRDGDELYVVIFNPVEYASFVEDGHMQRNRFVPGSFLGGKFEYIPGYPMGMVLSNKWIPGYHMARIAITKIEQEIPKRFERAFRNFVTRLEVT